MHKGVAWLLGGLLAGSEAAGEEVVAPVAPDVPAPVVPAAVGPLAVLVALGLVALGSVPVAVALVLEPEVLAGATGPCAPQAASDVPNPRTAARVSSLVTLLRLAWSRRALFMPPLLLSCRPESTWPAVNGKDARAQCRRAILPYQWFPCLSVVYEPQISRETTVMRGVSTCMAHIRASGWRPAVQLCD